MIEQKLPRRKYYAAYGLAATMLIILAGCGGSSDVLTSAERGQAIYSQNCQVCHGDAATGKEVNPNTPVHSPEGHTWHHADGQLVQIILGQLNFPGRTMPSFEGKLSEDDVMDVLAYLKSGWRPDQLEFQAEASRNWELLEESN